MPEVVFTDLDGTLLSEDGLLSEKNKQALATLGAKNILRIAATGRSLFSARKALKNWENFDYVIFSSGAGVVECRTDELIYTANLDEGETSFLIALMQSIPLDFMVHKPIPDNHYFYYWEKENPYQDFLLRKGFYPDFFEPLGNYQGASSQILTICPYDYDFYLKLQQYLADYSVVKATAPFTPGSMWLEIFNKAVSKGKTAKWLTDKLGIAPKNCYAVGNDYNDIDLLDFAGKSFVVADATPAVKKDHTVLPKSSNNGFAEILKWLT